MKHCILKYYIIIYQFIMFSFSLLCYVYIFVQNKVSLTISIQIFLNFFVKFYSNFRKCYDGCMIYASFCKNYDGFCELLWRFWIHPKRYTCCGGIDAQAGWSDKYEPHEEKFPDFYWQILHFKSKSSNRNQVKFTTIGDRIAVRGLRTQRILTSREFCDCDFRPCNPWFTLST